MPALTRFQPVLVLWADPAEVWADLEHHFGLLAAVGPGLRKSHQSCVRGDDAVSTWTPRWR
jgi:hypothetical protein